jgi:hypothetical protein
MPDHQPQGEVMPPIEGERAHESTEIKAGPIVLFGLALVVLGAIIHLVLGGVMGRFAGQESKIVASRPPLFSAAVDSSGPHLQGDPATDRIRAQKQQLEQLSSYGWVDRSAGIAHIPIDRAMDLLAESSSPELLTPEKAGAGTAAPVPDDSKANSRPAERQPARVPEAQGVKP